MPYSSTQSACCDSLRALTEATADHSDGWIPG
jgi:hypothetical protein